VKAPATIRTTLRVTWRDRRRNGLLILFVLVLGLAAGWAAQIVLNRTLTWAGTLALGLAGSVVGGLLVSLLAGDGLELRMSGILGSIVGAIVLLAVGGLVFGGSPRTSPRRAR
jgi:uncharacterized membrane protein YeaQ/YmgE (transglycosylase-associated protein family)